MELATRQQNCYYYWDDRWIVDRKNVQCSPTGVSFGTSNRLGVTGDEFAALKFTSFLLFLISLFFFLIIIAFVDNGPRIICYRGMSWGRNFLNYLVSQTNFVDGKPEVREIYENS